MSPAVSSSFRDPDNIVFEADGQIQRGLSERGRRDWELLAQTAFFRDALASGAVVGTEASDAPVPASYGEWVLMLRHERVPIVSYAYEWPFEMLRDAALLELDLTARALREGMVTKDATPYNVLWRGSSPVHVDVGSFTRLDPGQPWDAYRQFCSLFLYPLFLSAHKGIPFQAWLRGSLSGIEPMHMRRLYRGVEMLRRGVPTHVYLHAKVEARHERDAAIREQLRDAGFGAELIQANVRKLTRLVSTLQSRVRGGWDDYSERGHYAPEDLMRKEAFVEAAVAAARPKVVWDIGCNDGHFSEIASRHAEHVVALDSDAAVVDHLYVRLKARNERRIHPLVLDVTNPSPDLGWRSLERPRFAERARPDLVLLLAVAHHLALSASIPTDEIVAWLADLDASAVVELPTLADEKVQLLLARRREDVPTRYGAQEFEAAATAYFTIVDRLELPSSARVLYSLRRRDTRST